MTLDDVIVLELAGGGIAVVPRGTPITFAHARPEPTWEPASGLREKSHRQLAREALPELARAMKERA